MSIFLSNPTLLRNGFRSLMFLTPSVSISYSTCSVLSSDDSRRKNWRQPVVSALELGGVKIAKEDVVKEDPTNNVPDSIFSKLGMQLHRRPTHPLGILKNAIFDYFDTNYPNKFDDLCPIVSAKENFDDVLVPADHVSRSYNDTYYVDSEAVLRCHTSALQAELLRKGHTHFLVIGDVYRRDSIDATHYPVFHQMEGVRVFCPYDWEASGMDATSYAAGDLKTCLEGLASHLFGAVEMRWVDTYFPFTNPSFELEIYFQVNIYQHMPGEVYRQRTQCCWAITVGTAVSNTYSIMNDDLEEEVSPQVILDRIWFYSSEEKRAERAAQDPLGGFPCTYKESYNYVSLMGPSLLRNCPFKNRLNRTY